ncbi:thioesterase domain-containing protein [Streptomyces sp. NPDC005301]|uniref:thioesterase II family protein n=1 Tax=Streptomyces sp. NPDC005301 TaxID=3156874 RepID=UPI0033A97357
MRASRDPWIRELRRGRQPVAHVVFFPHAGGAATFFTPFAPHFPDEFDLSAVQYPGRQERLAEPFVPTVEGLADQVVPSLRRYAETHVPLVLFGHSMGATVAFETAVRLAAAHPGVPRHLVVSGRSAPSVHRSEGVHHGSDQEVMDHLAALGGTGDGIVHSPDLMELLLPAIRNDYRAVELYRPAVHTTVPVPVLCLTGEQDARVTPEDAAAWKRHTSGDFRQESFPGGHFFLSEHRAAVARLVADRARSAPWGTGRDSGG